MKITSAAFHSSAVDLDGCPDPSLPEFALIGRSNVGKSTLLNALTGKRDLARVSKTPGFTKLINFFTVNNRWRLVDLPGYGYAKVGKEKRAIFSELISTYIQGRPNLCGVFVLIDSSIPPQGIDLDFIHWLIQSSRPFVLVFTKTDKAGTTVIADHIEQFQMRIASWCEELPLYFRVSAKSGKGITDLLEVIQGTLSSK
ncbi:MAG: hypothetical protein RLZZ399_596 [Verrucomicrobiota bacterium]|jgi:GTP-binding protein